MLPFRASLALACLAALGVRPAAAGQFPNADRYFELRDRAVAIVESLSADELQTQPHKFENKLIEIRGEVTGVSGSSTHGNFLITPANGPAVGISLPPGQGLDRWPVLDVGNTLRVLCRVVRPEGSASGSLELVAPVKEHEAAAEDAARQKAAAEKAAVARRKAAPPVTASRGAPAAAARPVMRFTQSQVLDQYAGAVRYFNRRLSMDEARQIAGLILNYSHRYGLDARLVMAVIACESNFNTNAISRAGAQGLGQLMPGTAAGLGVADAWDPAQNLEGSTRLLRGHIDNMKRGGRPTKDAIKLALACYNAGAGAVKKYKGIPPYRETQAYVAKIIRLYWSMLPASERTWSPD
jgi:soluble lytic murein transglycosylase-like protein